MANKPLVIAAIVVVAVAGVAIWQYTGQKKPAEPAPPAATTAPAPAAPASAPAVAPAAAPALAGADAIKARKDGFQVFRASMGAIKKVVDAGGPAADAAAPASAIAAQAAKQVAFFVPGSDTGETKAKSDIWANMADFTGKMKAAEDAAVALAAAAATGSADAVKAGFGALGATCGACHKAYRND